MTAADRQAIWTQVRSQPWAIHPDALRELTATLAAWRDTPTPEAVAGGRIAGGAATTRGSVAILPIRGIITPRPSLFSWLFGGATIDELAAAIDSLVADSSIVAIVLDVDSPGGMVGGVPELAERIRAARSQKPIVALSNTLMASAAYWLASQADELVVTPSSLTGSIGIVMGHVDVSEQERMLGIKTTLVHAGAFKVEQADTQPLSNDARAHLQNLCDEAYGLFLTAIARGRGVAPSAVRANFGQGRLLSPPQAVAVKMADRVGTLLDAVMIAARAGARSSGGARGSASAMADIEIARAKVRARMHAR